MEEDNNAHKPTSRHRRIRLLVPLIAAMIVFFLLLLPTIITHTSIRHYLVHLVGNALSHTIEIEKIELSWLGKQRLQGVHIHADDNSLFLSVTEIHTTSSLLTILFGDTDLATTHIISPKLEVWTSAAAPSQHLASLQSQLQSGEKTKEKKNGNNVQFQFPFRGTIKLIDGTALIHKPTYTPVKIHHIQGEISSPSHERPFFFQAKAAIEHDTTAGHAQLSMTLDSAFKKNGRTLKLFDSQTQQLYSDAVGELSLSLENIPLVALDRLLLLVDSTTQGIISDTLGDHLDATGEIRLRKGVAHIALETSSPQLTSNIFAEVSSSHFAFTKMSRIDYVLTPAAMSRLWQLFPNQHHIQLTHPIAIKVLFDALTMPIKNNKPNFFPILASSITINQLEGIRSPMIGDLNIEDLRAKIDTYPDGNLFFCNVYVEALYDNKPAIFKAKSKTTSFPFLLHNILNSDAHQELFASIERIPTSLIDRLFNSQGVFMEAFGKTTTASISYTSKDAEGICDVSIQTDNLQSSHSTFQINHDKAYLSRPHTFTYLVSPPFFQRLIRTKNIPINHDVLVTLNIDQLVAPLPLSFKTMLFDVNLHVTPCPVNTPLPMTTFSLQQATIHIANNHTYKYEVSGSANITLMPSIAAMIGEQLSFNFYIPEISLHAGVWAAPLSTLKAETPLLNLKLQTSATLSNTLQLPNGLHIHGAISSSLFTTKQWPIAPTPPTEQKDIAIDFSLNPSEIPLFPSSLQPFVATGKLKIAETDLQLFSSFFHLPLSSPLEIQLNSNLPDDTLFQIDMRGATSNITIDVAQMSHEIAKLLLSIF
ncbi:hypothetical protein JYU14_04245 [Simkania negevensis]|uniref:AsmA-like C-terminal domain-containing protein n=1 Tax=Simkania negevensis TaxID=83561 RepID=A0ABS3ASB6_9BACT|nr:hypothetical protein [Simkania negevensis]